MFKVGDLVTVIDNSYSNNITENGLGYRGAYGRQCRVLAVNLSVASTCTSPPGTASQYNNILIVDQQTKEFFFTQERFLRLVEPEKPRYYVTKYRDSNVVWKYFNDKKMVIREHELSWDEAGNLESTTKSGYTQISEEEASKVIGSWVIAKSGI